MMHNLRLHHDAIQRPGFATFNESYVDSLFACDVGDPVEHFARAVGGECVGEGADWVDGVLESAAVGA